MRIDTRIFSVSEINAVIKDLLQEAFPEVWIKGEISNLKNYGGNLFFTLKDGSCQIRGILFRGHAGALKFAPRDGSTILARGTLTLYETRGEFQLQANYMEPLGIGTLKLAFEELKKKLAAKGYFDEAHKKAIPSIPGTIGVITSPQGAVIRDILTILKRRFSNVRVIIFPVKVQGEGAAEDIARAVAYADKHFSSTIDVLILARGGGSIEDLFAFNEEIVADALYRTRIPVISAVGHETDFTIADFVADLRAPTPSAAAELVVSRKADIVEAITAHSRRFSFLGKRQTLRYREKIESEKRMLRSPTGIIRMARRNVDSIENIIRGTMAERIRRFNSLLSSGETGLRLLSPVRRLHEYRSRMQRCLSESAAAMRVGLIGRRERFSSLSGTVDALSPFKTLARGYSIVFNVNKNAVLKDSGEVSPGDPVTVKLFRGTLSCTVTGAESDG